MIIIKRLLIAMLPLFLLACGTVMTKEDCKTANWYQQGMEDGAQGEPKDKLGRYNDACSGTGVTPDRDRYVLGYTKGLKEFCTYENGFERGKAAGAPHSCASDSEYRVGYQDGLKRHEEDRERREVEKLTRPSGNTQVGAPGGM